MSLNDFFAPMKDSALLPPSLEPGIYTIKAEHLATTNNLFLVDGQNDNDSRLGGSQGTQAHVTLGKPRAPAPQSKIFSAGSARSAFHSSRYHHRLAQTIDTPAWLSQFVEP
jgi:hypothetical protein